MSNRYNLFSTSLRLLLFCFLPLAGFAQIPFEEGYTEGANRAQAYAITPSGNDFVVVGTIASPNDIRDILLFEVDLNSMVTDPVRIGDVVAPAEEWGYDVKAEPQGAYVVAGASRSNNQTRPLLVQTTNTGSIQWSAAYPEGTFDGAFYAVDAVRTYGYVAAGFMGNPLNSGADNDLYLSIISNNTGSLFCANTFGGNGNEVAYDVIELSNGNLLAVGSTESFGTDGKALYVVAIDSFCNKVWSRYVDGPGDDIGYAVVEDNFGVTIAGQSNSYSTGNRWNTMLTRFSLNGLYLSTNIIDNPNQEDGARGIAFEGNSTDNYYILSGQTLGADSTGWIMKINSTFGIDWFHLFSGNTIRDISLTPAPDTQIGAGSIIPSGSSLNDAYVLHADAMGLTGSTCNPTPLNPTISVVQPNNSTAPDTIQQAGTGATLSLGSASVVLDEYDACTFVGLTPGLPGHVALLPNPTDGRFRVEFILDGLRETRVELYDLQGRMQLTRDLGTTDHGVVPLDLSDFPAGTYLMRLRAERNVWTRKVIVR
ncbi:MAG: T9SS type A sorting domain-containing protein [Bacteroidota bacterium]